MLGFAGQVSVHGDGWGAGGRRRGEEGEVLLFAGNLLYQQHAMYLRHGSAQTIVCAVTLR